MNKPITAEGVIDLASIREAVRVEVATCKERFIDCDEATDRIMAIFLQPETAELDADIVSDSVGT